MDELDEKSFSLDEIHEFCTEFFIGTNDTPLSNPCHDFSGFIDDLERILLKERLAFSPTKKKLCPWIDIDKLKQLFRRASVTGVGMRERVSYCRAPPGMDKFANMGGRKNRDPQPSRPFAFGRSQTEGPSMPQAPQRTRTDPFQSQPRATTGDHLNRQGSATQKQQGSKTRGQPKNLEEAIKMWSHQPPDYKNRMNSLAKLLVDVPTLFPATNEFVEDHEYFDKWKEVCVCN